jgi:hypothetical protein
MAETHQEVAVDALRLPALAVARAVVHRRALMTPPASRRPIGGAGNGDGPVLGDLPSVR